MTSGRGGSFVAPGGSFVAPGGSFVVLAKEPAAGRVKTRLCPPLSPEEAAELYGCMLDDVLESTVAAGASIGWEVVLPVDPPAACPALARRAPAGVRVVAQREGDLGVRMAHAVAQAAAAGAGGIVLRGNDSPAVGAGALVAAAAALGGADVVLAPDPDGGYSLVGLRRPVAGLFEHPMSHGDVLEQTLALARDRGLATRTLDPGFDLDTESDLARLVSRQDAAFAADCRRTLAWLDGHPGWAGTAA